MGNIDLNTLGNDVLGKTCGEPISFNEGTITNCVLSDIVLCDLITSENFENCFVNFWYWSNAIGCETKDPQMTITFGGDWSYCDKA